MSSLSGLACHMLCAGNRTEALCAQSVLRIIDLKVARSRVSLPNTWLFSLFSAAQILGFLYVGVILRYPQPIKSLGENTEDNGDVLRPLPAPGELHLSAAAVFTSAVLLFPVLFSKSTHTSLFYGLQFYFCGSPLIFQNIKARIVFDFSLRA